MDSVNFLKYAQTDEQVQKMFAEYSIDDRIRLPSNIYTKSPQRPFSHAKSVQDNQTKMTSSTHLRTSLNLSSTIKSQGDLR